MTSHAAGKDQHEHLKQMINLWARLSDVEVLARAKIKLNFCVSNDTQRGRYVPRARAGCALRSERWSQNMPIYGFNTGLNGCYVRKKSVVVAASTSPSSRMSSATAAITTVMRGRRYGGRHAVVDTLLAHCLTQSQHIVRTLPAHFLAHNGCMTTQSRAPFSHIVRTIHLVGLGREPPVDIFDAL